MTTTIATTRAVTGDVVTPVNAAADSVLTASFLVSGTDIFALGHYPGNPIYPGVLIAERLAGLAAALAGRELGGTAAVRLVKRIQYLAAVLPGDWVEMQASVRKTLDHGLEIAAVARVGERICTRASFHCVPGELPEAKARGPWPAEPGARALTHRALAGVLPHRYPFLLVDTVEDYQPGTWLRARKVVGRGSPLFLEGLPASYPQGLVIESIGQAGIALFFLSGDGAAPVDILLGSLSETEFFHQIPFEVVLTLEARIERMLPNGVIFSGEARVGDTVVTRVGSLVAMADPRPVSAG